MAMAFNQYCTADDILGVAYLYAHDVAPLLPDSSANAVYEPNTYRIPRSAVDDIADEATQYVRNVVAPHYKLDVIDAYYPAFPPVIVAFTKTVGAMMMYERYGVLNPEFIEKYTKPLTKWIERYSLIVTGLNLRDVDGEKVPTAIGAGGMLTAPGDNFGAFNAIKAFPAAALRGASGG
jgi:hypothetical protein